MEVEQKASTKKKKRASADSKRVYAKRVKHGDTATAKAAAVTAHLPPLLQEYTNAKDAKLKFHEPSDMMRNVERQQELRATEKHLARVDEENATQKALATHLLPRPSEQSVHTLAISPNALYQQSDPYNALHRQSLETGTQVFPMARLVENGFTPAINPNIEQEMRVISKMYMEDIDFIDHRRQQQPTTSSVAQQEGRKQSSTIVKMKVVNGGCYQEVGYNRRTNKDQKECIRLSQNSDMARRFAEFYKNDQLFTQQQQQHALIVYGCSAENRLLQRLKQKYLKLYQQKDNVLCDSASLVSRVDPESVSREYLRTFRERPSKDDALCSNGAQCVFNTFTSDRNDSYVGRVFYTPREKERRATNLCSQDGLPLYNHQDLCIDCLLKSYTQQYHRNIQQERVVAKQINYFTVKCDEPTQYALRCMLGVEKNDRPTGIVGYVPEFALNRRKITYVTQINQQGERLRFSTQSMLVETGMDF
jgi:hypothetical protein